MDTRVARTGALVHALRGRESHVIEHVTIGMTVEFTQEHCSPKNLEVVRYEVTCGSDDWAKL